MFKTATRPRIRQPVPLIIEVDGEQQDHGFVATFQILPSERTSEETLADDKEHVFFLKEAVVDMSDIDVPFTPALLADLLDRFEVRVALIRAYFEAAKKAAGGN